MMALKNKLRRRSDKMWNRASDALYHPIETAERCPYATGGGLIVLILGIVTFIWLFPELRRYIKMERM